MPLERLQEELRQTDILLQRDSVGIVRVGDAGDLLLEGFLALEQFSLLRRRRCLLRRAEPQIHEDKKGGNISKSVQLEFGIPIGNGILTTDTEEQAIARRDKGAEAVRVALEMARLPSSFATLKA